MYRTLIIPLYTKINTVLHSGASLKTCQPAVIGDWGVNSTASKWEPLMIPLYDAAITRIALQ